MGEQITPVVDDCPGAPSMLSRGTARTICTGSHAIPRCARYRYAAGGVAPKPRRDEQSGEIVCDSKIDDRTTRTGDCAAG